VGRSLSDVFEATGSRGEQDPFGTALTHRRRFHDVRVRLPAAGDIERESIWRITGMPLVDSTGAFKGFRGVAQDDVLQRTIDGIPMSILVWSSDDHIVCSNRTLQEVLGVPPEDVLGLDFADFVARLDIVIDEGTEALDPRSMDGRRFWVRDRHGTLRRHATRVTPIETPAGRLFMAIYIDVSEQVSEIARVRADELARVAASAAHDVGNALSVLGGVVTELVDADRELRSELAEDMRETLASMRSLLERLQLLASAESSRDRSRQEFSAIDVPAATARIARLFSQHYPRANLELRATDATRSLLVLMDHVEFERTLTNLLTNAIEAAGSQARILLRIALDNAQSGHTCTLTVEDDGAGFAAGIETRAMDLFASAKETEGTGLGLYQVGRAVHSSGGSVRIGRSALGGALVELTLPLANF
jgi:PAS domain S-box-containing protein